MPLRAYAATLRFSRRRHTPCVIDIIDFRRYAYDAAA